MSKKLKLNKQEEIVMQTFKEEIIQLEAEYSLEKLKEKIMDEKITDEKIIDRIVKFKNEIERNEKQVNKFTKQVNEFIKREKMEKMHEMVKEKISIEMISKIREINEKTEKWKGIREMYRIDKLLDLKHKETKEYLKRYKKLK